MLTILLTRNGQLVIGAILSARHCLRLEKHFSDRILLMIFDTQTSTFSSEKVHFQIALLRLYSIDSSTVISKINHHVRTTQRSFIGICWPDHMRYSVVFRQNSRFELIYKLLCSLRGMKRFASQWTLSCLS